jgi:uncharacterized protein YggE
MKLASIAALAVLVAVAIALSGVGRPGTAHGSAAPSVRTITVNGSGTGRLAPDEAVFSFGVESDGTTARAALAANAAQMRRIIAALRRTGIARADLRTENVSVYPRRSDFGAVEGFSASGSVSATVRRLSRAGAAVDAAVAAGANETSGPQFDRSSRTALYQQALRAAFADARAKAQTLAREAGAGLGGVRRIDESAPAAPQPVYQSTDAANLARTPIEPGTQETLATVTVTFSLA